MAMLKGHDVDDREWAAGQLAILPARGYPQVASALQEATRDSSPAVRLAALHALANMQPEPNMLYMAAAPLTRDPDDRVRAEALENLRRLGVAH
jgi:HEAT repeat protein